MKDLTLFYLEGCPYCRNARRALEELEAENPAYAAVPIDWVEESQQPGLAGRYDYYYVPTVYAGARKLYEARPGESFAQCKASLRSALDFALAD